MRKINPKKHPPASNHNLVNLKYASSELQQWLLKTPAGREILRKERLFYMQNVQNTFGNYSLQIGLAEINLLQGNKIHNHYTINLDLEADLHFMPFATESMDLIICPHVFEFIHDYEYVLQELYRILAPNGKIILTCFNQQSWFGLFSCKIPLFKKAGLIRLAKLKSQLEELNFGIAGGKFFSYCPPFNQARQLRRYHWLNKVGDRWFPTLANSFALILRKEVVTPTLIKPSSLESFQTLQPSLGTARICNKN
jgi:SAM-dependent methyltransferase